MRALKFRVLGLFFFAVAVTVFAQSNLLVKSQRWVGNWFVQEFVNVWNDAGGVLVTLADRNGQGALGVLCLGGTPSFMVRTKFAILGKKTKGVYRIGGGPAVEARWLVTSASAFDPTFVLDERGLFDVDRSMDGSLFFQKLLKANPPLFVVGVKGLDGEMHTLIFDLKGVRELPSYVPCLRAPGKGG